ncbi:type IX secretion system sortase PorU [Carboxylicivirga caseinilyticus]|uniref:type IX secretion system sortase PorU n=1 Tax=Carboxylicivirga caseinilyticus TaxID=3417572 RepID=UPI003D33B5FA|nr:type IX secretion system sortase PorU [Marinilabiliaceae bacterium A049]
MNKKIILSFISLFVLVGLNAQSFKESIDIKWNICNEYQPYLSFDNQSGQSEEGLPLLLLQYPIQSNISIDNIDIKYKSIESSSLNAFEVSVLDKINPQSLTTIQKHIVTIRKQNYLELTIIPIVYNEQLMTFNKVSRFQVEVMLPEGDSLNENLKSELNAKTASNSVLGSGKWVKVSISESGVYKIPYSVLTSWGFGNGQNVKVFGNGGNMLPKLNGTARLDDLQENAIMHYNNAIYFYAQGPVKWTYNSQRDMFLHQIHDYSDEAYYFLTEDVGEGKMVQTSSESYETYTTETSEYDSYTFFELELINMVKSGRTWYGERILAGDQQQYDFTFPNLNLDKPIKLMTSFVGHSNLSSSVQTFVNGSESALQTISIPSVVYGTSTGSVAQEAIGQSSFYSDSKDVSLLLQYNTTASGAYGYLNYYSLNANETLVLEDQLEFRNKDVVGNGNITRFYIANTNSSSILWDVSNHLSPVQLELKDYGSKRGFTTSTGYIKEFVVFDPTADFSQPTYVEEIENQDLHGETVPEMLIVSHPLFLEQAKRLAQLHNQKTGLECLIVEPEQVYNEFSSGQPDVSAIRDFARYLYNKDNNKFKYLLLFGNGSYDNRSTDSDNTNFILTYQSENSINYSNSYTSDDFFGLLDLTEGEYIQNNKLDIGIGRFPVNTVQQAKIVVDKIEKYMFDPLFTNWKSTLTFVGDDGDNNLHMRQAELLTQKVKLAHPGFDMTKIYFDAYDKVTTSSGDRYPGVNEAVAEALNQGTLIFNYTGHGGERYLAHENILDKSAIQSLSNFSVLPLFVTATCEFSRYDDWTMTDGTAGEAVLTTPNGGGIALLTTTRVAWSSSNFDINTNLYNYIFEKDANGEKLRLGDIIKSTKNASGNTINKLNFTLLGDPALQLNYPTNNISINKINDEMDPAKQDTLKALDLISIEGVIGEGNENMFEDGTVTVKVFDKPVTITTLGNGGTVPFEFEVYQNRIFKGDVDVKNDTFNVSFMVPKDIRYHVGNGRVSFYGSDFNQVEAFGANNEIMVGGVTDNQVNDEEGPEITIWLNTEGFKSGDITGTRPILYATFYDQSGINTSGVGIGHDITLTIDDERASSSVLNEYYNSNNNDYQRGTLSYQLSEMETGRHKLELKAWDNLNNSTSIEIEFVVELSGELKVNNTMLYPNPVMSGETIKISFDHDAPNSMLDATLRLFDLSGRLIDLTEQQVSSVGGAVSPFDYQLPSFVPKGLYILRCEFVGDEGQTGVFSKKILVVE